ncbi:MAG: HAD family phosphatase [Clostridia bacterium]|nr:HAD family phosphatase [Clostridia bacterium]
MNLKIKGAIFDMDGTLVDSLILWDVLWKTFDEKFCNGTGFRPDAEADKNVRTMTMKDAMEYIHKTYSIGESGEQLLLLANEIMLDFYSNRVELKPGVMEFLEKCKEKNVKMCIASATAPKLVEIAMEHCDIKKYFEKNFSCADIGKGKESPDIFLIAREYLGTPIEETCVFEDSYVALSTACDAGFKTVGVYDKYGFRHDILKEKSTVYIAEDEKLTKIEIA